MIGYESERGVSLSRAGAAPHLAAHGDGAIVNIVDISVFTPFPNLLAHSVAKAGLLSMTYALAMELAPAVRVDRGWRLAPSSRRQDTAQSRLMPAARRTLLRRWGTPEDVGEAVVFLASAPYVTGVVLPVDGGERLGMYQK